MNLKSIYDKKNNVFQSSVWAEFQKAVGREAVDIDGAYFYKEHLIRDKSFLFCPKGPLREITNIKKQISNKLQNSNDQSVIFVRVEPDFGQARMTDRRKQNDENDKDYLGSHPVVTGKDPFLKPVTKNSILSQQYSPKQTLVLDLTKTEDEILANMKSKHRYNIRLAEKKGVTIRQGVSKKDVDSFYELSLEVADRDATFAPHPKSYYEKMAEVLGKDGHLQIFTAESEGKPLSSIIILFYNDTAIYLHGASSSEGRELMPNHLAQWEAIKEAKKRGCKYYDFWGVSLKRTKSSTGSHPTEAGKGPIEDFIVDEDHSWAGITKFKIGFVKMGITGKVVEFPGAYDLPIDKLWYNGLSHLNKLKKLFKH